MSRIVYTIASQETCDDRIVTQGPIKVQTGKAIFPTVDKARAFVRAMREPWHAWCAVYEVRLSPGAKLDRASRPYWKLLGSGLLTRRVWPTRAHAINVREIPAW